MDGAVVGVFVDEFLCYFVVPGQVFSLGLALHRRQRGVFRSRVLFVVCADVGCFIGLAQQLLVFLDCPHPPGRWVEVKCVTGMDDNSRFIASAMLVARATARPV